MSQKTQTEKSYLVFISHSAKDRWIAKQIANLIEEKGKEYGVKTFLDEKDIAGGESIPELIKRNIQDCGEFLILLSRYSIDRPWVLIEIGAAWVLGKRIIAIIDKVTPEEMPDIITPYKAIDLNNFDKYLEEFMTRVKEHDNEYNLSGKE
ncbi:MAG TPA: toll/interleukin-1 receptor domain-containing protein [Thermodesulfovibrionia bacterium]|nr:toll/interleukin-1 receptor domain-containing protein [Thermodesulfovibrionia bacterium]